MLKNELKKQCSLKTTENGAIVYDSSMDKVVDLFAQIGAMRNRYDYEKYNLFMEAYNQDPTLALKTLFYARDCREGQGERNTFREMYQALIDIDTPTAIDNISNIVEFGRWDDLIHLILITENKMFIEHGIDYINNTIYSDLNNKEVSLLGKWLPSINTSSKETVSKAKKLRKMLDYSERQYRKLCSELRSRINVVERKLSSKQYDKINYESVPSLAMLKYKNCFKTKDADRYNEYIQSVVKGESKINASTLYPYDIVRKYKHYDYDDQMEEQWKALPNYVKPNWNGLVVADVSGSMNNYLNGLPMDVSISLAIYIAEKTKGSFSDCFITFSERPTFVDLEPCKTLHDKIRATLNADWGLGTNLKKVFDLILNIAIKNNASQSEMPQQLFIITDMEFDAGSGVRRSKQTFMESIKDKYNQAGYELPKLVWWNVNARNSTFPMTVDEYGVQYVSGCSPVILKTLLGGEFLSPIDVVRNTVVVERYKNVKVMKHV